MGGAATSFADTSTTSVELVNESLSLVLDTPSGRMLNWHPEVLDRTAAPIHDFAKPAQKFVVLQGEVAGMPVAEFQQQAGGWQIVEQQQGSVSLALHHTNGVSLHQNWSLDDSKPWQATYSLWLQTDLDETANSTPVIASLWLEVGPGIGETPATGLGIAQNLYSFTQGVVSAQHDVSRIQLSRDELSVNSTKPVEWLGLQSRYFAFVLALEEGNFTEWQFSAPADPQWHYDNTDFETELRVGLPILIANTTPINIRVFGGAKSYPILQQAEPALDQLLFPDLWSWMRALTLGMMHVLNAISSVIGNWGLAILLLAVFVRLLIHPLAKRAMTTQKRFVALQQKINPELKEIKRNYKGAEQSELILQLYERHNTSPFAGLKPLLIVLLQVPIFVALYHLLGQHFELRSQSFLWMNSLAEPDQFFSFGVDLPFFGSYFNLMPTLMALTTLASIKLSPTPSVDSGGSLTQSLMLVLMALGFYLLFYSFPSGMVLYWSAANILQLLHHYLVGLGVSGRSKVNE